VSQSFFAVGYGDLVELVEEELIFNLLISLFGTLILLYVIGKHWMAASISTLLVHVRLSLFRLFKIHPISKLGFLLPPADITAAQVDSDEIRGSFTEKRKCLVHIFRRERLHSSWIK
jgi:hypothetical protein